LVGDELVKIGLAEAIPFSELLPPAGIDLNLVQVVLQVVTLRRLHGFGCSDEIVTLEDIIEFLWSRLGQLFGVQVQVAGRLFGHMIHEMPEVKHG
jgi:hypothetical protein